MIFAEGGLPPAAAWPSMLVVVIGLGGVTMIVVLGLTLVEKWQAVFGKKPQPAPQPFVVTTPEQFVDVAELREFKAEVSEFKTDVHNQLKEMRSYMHEEAHKTANTHQGIVLKIDELRKDMASEGSRRAATIHNRVDGLAKEVAATTAASQQSHASQVLLSQKVDTLILELRKDGRAAR